MRLATSREQRDFFTKKGYIEFDDLISLGQVQALRASADAALKQRRGATRDLGIPEIRSLLFKTPLAEVAADLFKTLPLRLAYDQWIETNGHSPFAHPVSLQQVSCFDPIVGGLILQLSDEPAEAPVGTPFCPVPHKTGSGIFFSPRALLAFNQLFALQGQTLLLIAFCAKNTLYILNENDPYTHALKKEGYAFGDSLKSPRHPILFG